MQARLIQPPGCSSPCHTVANVIFVKFLSRQTCGNICRRGHEIGPRKVVHYRSDRIGELVVVAPSASFDRIIGKKGLGVLRQHGFMLP